MKNIRLILYFSLLIIFLIYVCVSYKLFTNINNLSRESDEKTFEKIEENGVIFFLVYKDSMFSFGSGHKYLYVFSKNKLFLGKCKFGEFPLTIKDVSKKEIFLEINNFSNMDYAESWKKKNKRIWKYKIIYIQNNSFS